MPQINMIYCALGGGCYFFDSPQYGRVHWAQKASIVLMFWTFVFLPFNYVSLESVRKHPVFKIDIKITNFGAEAPD